MSDLDQRIASLSRERLLLLNTRLQERLGEMEQAAREPIAVLSIGCRFPGAKTPDELWQLLCEGRDTIKEVPPERWDIDAFYSDDPNAEAKMYTRYGSFIEDVAGFDHRFFGISRREALSMDPQQRLLLETSWEALERAGWAGDRLRRARTGVFVGVGASSYTGAVSGTGQFDAYSGTGNSMCVAAGRISFFLGLEGPSIALDTSCSSSLVAIDLACRYLRARECDVALAGGVNLTLSPEVTIYFCKFKALSPTGRCHTFDAAADGYVRGEGCGVLVLKRLSDALAGRDPIIGLIRGSAVGHDGRTGGLTVPSRHAQADVIRAAQRAAGIDPAEIDYIEAHGTGTALGDPIEIQALADVFGDRGSGKRNLLVGSLKTNIGHTEAASGVAGVIKVLLALQHESIPAHLNLRNPNPLIPWNEMPITIPTRPADWRRQPDRPRIAGISSFGFSGTNAHVVVQGTCELPAKKDDIPEISRASHILTVSARTSCAAKTLADRVLCDVETTDVAIEALSHTSLVGRSHFPYRHVSVVRDRADAIKSLREWSTADVESQQPISSSTRTLMLIAPATSWDGFGRNLYGQEKDYRRIINSCQEVIDRTGAEIDISACFETLTTPTNPIESRIVDAVARLSLVQLLRHWSIVPTVVCAWDNIELAAWLAGGAVDYSEMLELTITRIMGIDSAVVPEPSESHCGILDPRTGKLTNRFANYMATGDSSDMPAGIVEHLAGHKYDVTYILGPSLAGKITPEADVMIELAQSGDSDDWHTVASLLVALHRCGATLDWEKIQASQPLRTVAYSTYPFERETFWRDRPRIEDMVPMFSLSEADVGLNSTSALDDIDHPMAVRYQPGPPPEARYVISADVVSKTLANLPLSTWLPEFLIAAVAEQSGEAAGLTANFQFGSETFEFDAKRDSLWLTMPCDINEQSVAQWWRDDLSQDGGSSSWTKLAGAIIDKVAPEDTVNLPSSIKDIDYTEVSGTEFYDDPYCRDLVHIVNSVKYYKSANIATLRMQREDLTDARRYHFHPLFVEGGRQVILSLLRRSCGDGNGEFLVYPQTFMLHRPAGIAALHCLVTEIDAVTFDAVYFTIEREVPVMRIRFSVEAKSAPDSNVEQTDAVGLPAPEEICAVFEPITEDQSDESWPTVNRICCEMLIDAMVELGLTKQSVAFQADELGRRLGIDPQMEEWVARWCRLAAEEGALEKVEDGWRLAADYPFKKEFPANGAEMVDDIIANVTMETAVGLCPYLPALLRANEDAEDTIGRIIQMFDRTMAKYDSVEIVASMVAELIAGILPTHSSRPLRVLEINAGAGMMTRFLRPGFGHAQYTVADTSPFLLSLTSRRFSDMGPITTAVIDLDAPLPPEHFGRYDIILCPSPWYAASSQQSLLRGCRELLVPGGLLLLALPTGVTPWLDHYYAVGQMGWRPTRMAVGETDFTARHWPEFLRDADFDQVDSIFGIDAPLPKTILVARASREALLVPHSPKAYENPLASQLEFWKRFWDSPRDEYSALLESLLCEEIAAVMGDCRPEDVDPNRPISELGFDSLSAVELSRRLDPVIGRMSISWQQLLSGSLRDRANNLAMVATKLYDSLRLDKNE